MNQGLGQGRQNRLENGTRSRQNKSFRLRLYAGFVPHPLWQPSDSGHGSEADGRRPQAWRAKASWSFALTAKCDEEFSLRVTQLGRPLTLAAPSDEVLGHQFLDVVVGPPTTLSSPGRRIGRMRFSAGDGGQGAQWRCSVPTGSRLRNQIATGLSRSCRL